MLRNPASTSRRLLEPRSNAAEWRAYPLRNMPPLEAYWPKQGNPYILIYRGVHQIALDACDVVGGESRAVDCVLADCAVTEVRVAECYRKLGGVVAWPEVAGTSHARTKLMYGVTLLVFLGHRSWGKLSSAISMVIPCPVRLGWD